MIRFIEDSLKDVIQQYTFENANTMHSFNKLAMTNMALATVNEGAMDSISKMVLPDNGAILPYIEMLRKKVISIDMLPKTAESDLKKLASNPNLPEAAVHFVYLQRTIDKFNPKYMPMYLTDMRAELLKAAKNPGDLKYGFPGLTVKYANGDLISKYKTQVIGVYKNGIIDPSSVEEHEPPVTMVLNKNSVNKTIIPELSYLNEKARKALLDELNSFQNELQNGSHQLNGMMDIVNEFITSPSIPTSTRRHVMKFITQVVYGWRAIVKYVFDALAEKARCFCVNTQSFTSLLSALAEWGDPYRESVNMDNIDSYPDEDKIASFKDNAFSVSKDIRRVIEDMATHDLHNQIPDNIDQVEFEHASYDDIAGVFKDVENQLRSFTVAIQEGGIFLTARETSGLQNGLDYIYAGKVSAVEETAKAYYKNPENTAEKDAVRTTIVAEMKKSDDLFTGISAQIKSCLDYMAQTKFSFQDRIESSDRVPVYQDCVEFFTTVRDDINFFILKIANAFFARYKYLLSLVELMSPYRDEVPGDVEVVQESDEYLDMAYEFTYRENEFDHSADCRNIMFAYNSARKMLTEGVRLDYTPATMFTEADEADNRQGTATPQGGGKPDANQTKANRLVEWIKTLFDKFRVAVDKLTKMNEAWLNKNEEALRSLKSASAVTMYPFFSIDPSSIPNNVTAATSKVKAINVHNLYQKTPESLFNEIYGESIVPTGKIKLPKDMKASNAAIVKQYYMVGTRPYKQVQYTPEQILRNIPAMIDYCKNYANTTKNLQTRLKNLGDAVSAKITEGEGLVKESAYTDMMDAYHYIMMEAETPAPAANATATPASGAAAQQTNANANGGKPPAASSVKIGSNEAEIEANKKGGNASAHSITAQIKALSSDYQAFSSAILSALEYRYYTYINVLRGLIRASKQGDDNAQQNANAGENAAPAQQQNNQENQ